MGVNGIYGLSGSGLDIESMVKVGMMSKQSQYDKMQQKYTLNEWKKTALLDVSSQITTFNATALSDYKMSSSMNSKTASSSNETAVKASANATAALMSHKVSVNSLSSNAYLIGKKNVISDIVTSNGGETGSIRLQDILFKGLNYTDSRETVTNTYNGGKTTTTTKTTFSGNSSLSVNTNKADDGTVVSTAKNGSTELTVTKDSDGTTRYAITSGSGTSVVTYKSGDNIGTFRYTSNTGEPVSADVSYSAGGLTFTANDGMTFTKNSDGTSSIALTDSSGNTTTFTVGTDNNTITEIKTNNGSTYSTSSSQAETVTTYATTFNDGKEITLTKTTSNGTTTAATYSDGTNTYTNGSVSADGKTFTFGSAGSNYYGKVTLNDSNPNNSSITVETQKAGITGSTTGGTELGTFYNGVALTDTAIAFKIGDGTNKTETISYTYEEILGGKTINDLISDINSAASNANVNIRAAYDSGSEIFSLYNSKGGEKNQILITALGNVENSSGANTLAGTAAKDFFNALGLKQSTGDSLVAPSSQSQNSSLLKGSDDSQYLTLSALDRAEGVAGTNGKVTVDGVEYDNITDNKITVGGVTYNLLNTTETGKTATVTVGQNVDGIVDKVKSFVESYNKILASLYEKYDEKSDSNYKPLTQSQKDAMKEEQVEKWEEKAKKGLLYHDQSLGKIINEMREAITYSVEGVSGKYNSAYSIGISTTGLKGQLVLDETKLRNALTEDSDSVYNVFAKLGNVKDEKGNEDTKYNGIAQRLGDIFTSAAKTIKSRAGSSSSITEDSDLNNLLRELQTKMSNFKKLMNAFEDKLYKKYDAMEVALAKLGSQLSFITGGQ